MDELIDDELHHQSIIIQLIKKTRRIYHHVRRIHQYVQVAKLISLACRLMPLYLI